MKELLSPAGNMECLKAAVNNGADAIYLGGKTFGARAYAGNFSNEELKEAVNYAHLYGVKIYITVNTIIYNTEVDELIKYIEYLYKIGVDALIMQDIGMISLVRKVFPNMEVHASTQCHNHNNEGIKLLKELGVTRIVLDREMSLEEIENIDVDIEKEVFIHGALCNCYSGCCLFSFMNGGRSGNRGECTQVCRLPFKLIKNGEYVNNESKYLLSTKELNTINNFNKLLDSDIISFKIEGRMKSPSYVGYVTRIYRKLIDSYSNRISSEEEDNLKILFNREFTNGYLFIDKVNESIVFMKKLTFILIGAGNRGKCYTQHAYMHGGYELVGIADPNEQTREFMREHYHIPKENCYKTYDELLARGKIADFAMICTQDRLHFAPAMKAIEQGYPLMLEKPVAPTPEECIQIRDAAEQKGVPVVVCHVLRYTPFARAVKQVIAEGRLGRIINIF